jgi:hypothetical protein
MENHDKQEFLMVSSRRCSIRAALLAGLFSAAVVGAGSASADAADRTSQGAVTEADMGAPPVIPRPMAPGTVPVKPKPVLTVPAVKPIPRPVPKPRPVTVVPVTPSDPLAGTGGIKPVKPIKPTKPVSVIPPGTGGIKPPRPVDPPELLGPPLTNPAHDPAGQPVVTLPWGPKPKPRPIPADTDPPFVDPNIVGYAEDGTPLYPWGPRPQPPKPIKNPPVVAELEPEPGPPIVRPDRFPPPAEAR